MRIGKVKHISNLSKIRRTYDEIEKMTRAVRCGNCRKSRKLLHLKDNPMTEMRACINTKCFLYVDLTKLTSWQEYNETKNGYESTTELECD